MLACGIEVDGVVFYYSKSCLKQAIRGTGLNFGCPCQKWILFNIEDNVKAVARMCNLTERYHNCAGRVETMSLHRTGQSSIP